MFVYGAIVCLLTLVWSLVWLIKWKRVVFDPLKTITPFAWFPIVGTTYVLTNVTKEEFLKIMRRIDVEHGLLTCIWMGFRPQIMVGKAEIVEAITNNSVHITKRYGYELLVPWLGQGLLTSSGSRWFQHRKLITPTFHFKILENFMEVFVEKTQMLLGILDKKTDGKFHNIYPNFTFCALDIICKTAMGISINTSSREDDEYVKAIYGFTDEIFWRYFRPYIPNFVYKFLERGKLYDQYLRTLHRFTRKVISERKAFLKTKRNSPQPISVVDAEIMGEKKRLSFLDLLLESSEDGKILNDEDIAEEVDTFMFEGHDTTTVSMSWTLLLLGNHPEIQERVYEEVSSVVQGKSTPTTLTELNELKCLERVIKESLRLYTIVPYVSRVLQHDIRTGGYKFLAGTQMNINIQGMHRHPEYFPDPERFDPDRFLPDNSIGRHPFSYIPFSAGPRNCIGQKFAMFEQKTILASIVKRFKVISLKSMKEIRAATDLILRPLDGVVVKLEKRE